MVICNSSRSVRRSSTKTTISSKLELEDVEVEFVVILGDDLQELLMFFFLFFETSFRRYVIFVSRI